jgi:hypothetical protein
VKIVGDKLSRRRNWKKEKDKNTKKNYYEGK